MESRRQTRGYYRFHQHFRLELNRRPAGQGAGRAGHGLSSRAFKLPCESYPPSRGPPVPRARRSPAARGVLTGPEIRKTNSKYLSTFHLLALTPHQPATVFPQRSLPAARDTWHVLTGELYVSATHTQPGNISRSLVKACHGLHVCRLHGRKVHAAATARRQVGSRSSSSSSSSSSRSSSNRTACNMHI